MILDLDMTIFVLHIVTLAVLYGFLSLVVLLVWRDIRAEGRRARAVMARLVVLDGGSSDLVVGQRQPITSRAVTTLGRSPDSAIYLPDPSVSATHATITWRAGRWWLEDRDSLNGTTLNESIIEKATLLCSGDVITLGQVRLRFEE